MGKTDILIADAHPLTREGIKSWLNKRVDLNVVGEVHDSKELFHKLASLKPNIVILDYDVTPHFSIDDVRKIKVNFPGLRILIISNNQKRNDILKILDSNVNGYLLKECDEEEVLGAVYAAVKGEKYFCGKVLNTIMEKVIYDCTPENDFELASLSARELEIIQYIAEGKTTKAISEILFLSFHTVGTHRKNIFKKLKIKNSSELILYAINKKIVSPETISNGK